MRLLTLLSITTWAASIVTGSAIKRQAGAVTGQNIQYWETLPDQNGVSYSYSFRHNELWNSDYLYEQSSTGELIQYQVDRRGNNQVHFTPWGLDPAVYVATRNATIHVAEKQLVRGNWDHYQVHDVREESMFTTVPVNGNTLRYFKRGANTIFYFNNGFWTSRNLKNGNVHYWTETGRDESTIEAKDESRGAFLSLSMTSMKVLTVNSQGRKMLLADVSDARIDAPVSARTVEYVPYTNPDSGLDYNGGAFYGVNGKWIHRDYYDTKTYYYQEISRDDSTIQLEQVAPAGEEHYTLAIDIPNDEMTRSGPGSQDTYQISQWTGPLSFVPQISWTASYLRYGPGENEYVALAGTNPLRWEDYGNDEVEMVERYRYDLAIRMNITGAGYDNEMGEVHVFALYCVVGPDRVLYQAYDTAKIARPGQLPEF
ncbi:hypothetical protein MKZ38_000725 [Zalerion maritima]|uniref:Uncharacterized protein n=1 Tax=Zalerion maritima TaxID=339359 RepID=A0AAD5RFN1_9PEZI|nr:hypothetical protein MKZ38_000725 [Zalerion maritima]